MPVTRDNGVVVPIGSDSYALTNDLSQMADTSNVATVIHSDTERSQLTTFEGRMIVRVDKHGLRETYIGGEWVGDSGWQTAGMSPAAGWEADGDFLYRIRDGVDVTLRGVVNRTGGEISISSPSGNIANTPVAKLPAALWPDRTQGMGSAFAGRTATFQITTGGDLEVVSVAMSTEPIRVAESLSFSGSYLLD